MGARLQNWFNKTIWDVSKSSAGPNFDLKGTDSWTRLVGYQDDFSGEPITERRAHQLATVYTCINVRAKTIASLPINILQEDDKGNKQSLSDHPAYYPLAQQPNNYMSSANMFMTSMIHSDSWGNSLIGINRDGRTRPQSFEIIRQEDWNAKISNGEAWYNIRGEMYRASDVLHFRWFSFDGLIGVSPIRQNAITMGKAFKTERYSGMTLGKKPPGLLSYEGEMKPETKAQNQKNWKEDVENGETPILSGRWKYQPIILPPGDAQYIETEGLTDQKICGIYSVPPSFIQNYVRMTWNNAEQVDLSYTKHTIIPIVRVIEQECNMKLFTEKEKKNTYVKFNLNGLLRADSKSRAEFYTAMRNVGGMNGNEIRELEDRNQYSGGDIFTTNAANIPMDQLRDYYKKMSEKTAPQPVKSRINGHEQEILN